MNFENESVQVNNLAKKLICYSHQTDNGKLNTKRKNVSNSYYKNVKSKPEYE
jgi:hypothetical protein